MTGVQDTNVIDVAGHTAEGEAVLFIVEDRAWDADPRQVDDLREKLITYAGYVADGSLVRQFPDMEGRPARIQIDCPEQPPPEIAALIDQARVSLQEFDIDLALNVRGY